MNRMSLLLSALLVTAGVASVGAQAGELYTPEQYQTPATSTASRLQVKQSVLDARASGELDHNEVDLPMYSHPSFGKTRAELKQEVLAARADGSLQHNEVDLPAVAKGSVETRQQVKNEYLASRKRSNAPGSYTNRY